MTAFRTRCPHCTSPFAVEASSLGKAVACPTCSGVVQIHATATGDQAVLPPSAAQPDPRWPPGYESKPRADGENEAAVESMQQLPEDAPSSGELPDPMAPVEIDPTESVVPASEEMTSWADASEVCVEDRPKTIIYKGRTIELRRVSPEEKQRRRWRRRIVLIFGGAVILIYYLLRGAGKI